MKLEENLISIIVPVYNAAPYLEKTIHSIQNQTYENWEAIFVDDASTDETGKIVRSYCSDDRIVYLRNKENRGVAESRNIGVRKARGFYVAFLDADDWWKKDKLSKQMNLMREKKAVLCYTARELYGNDGNDLHKIVHVSCELTYQKLLKSNSIACSSVLMKKEAAMEFPMSHDEYHEDYMVWLKCLKKYGVVYGIDEPLLCYRMSKGGKSRNQLKSAAMTYGMHRCMGRNVISALYYTQCHLLCAIKKYWLTRRDR